VLQAVQYLHAQCISHRDIKLENILFDLHQNAKLIDFGFSVPCKDRKLKVFCGTPSYMAPEIVRRTEYEGLPVDMWSLGIVLYACLCGKHSARTGVWSNDSGVAGCFPFRARNYPELYRKISRGVYSIPDELSSSVKDLLRSLLCADVKKRYTANQALQHSWISGMQAESLSWRIDCPCRVSDNAKDDLFDDVLDDLETFGIRKNRTQDSVVRRCRNPLSTLYYLLLTSYTEMGKCVRRHEHPNMAKRATTRPTTAHARPQTSGPFLPQKAEIHWNTAPRRLK
jgi:serine/threonine protein kinase